MFRTRRHRSTFFQTKNKRSQRTKSTWRHIARIDIPVNQRFYAHCTHRDCASRTARVVADEPLVGEFYVPHDNQPDGFRGIGIAADTGGVGDFKLSHNQSREGESGGDAEE